MKEKIWKVTDSLITKFNRFRGFLRDSGLSRKTCSMCGKKFISRTYWDVCPSCYIVLTKRKKSS